MKILLVAMVALMTLAQYSYATGLSNSQIPGDGDSVIPVSDTGALEVQIKAALLKATGLQTLQNFIVDWSVSSLKCLKVESEMNPDAQMGVCAVDVGALQISAKAAIVKKSQGYSVSIIFADVE